MRVIRETSVSVLFDGGNQSGMLAMYQATRAVIERAQAHGFALVGVNNIWMSGRSAYYVEMVARAGLIGIHTVAAPPMVAPPGGPGRPRHQSDRVRLSDGGRPAGDRPGNLGVHGHGSPVPAAARHRCRRAWRSTRMAAHHGRRSRARGAILPFGGHKGYALALAMHALGVLCSGTADTERDGISSSRSSPIYSFPLEDYRRVLAVEIAAIKATPRQEGVDEIRIPGERAYRERARPLRASRSRRIHEALIASPRVSEAPEAVPDGSRGGLPRGIVSSFPPRDPLWEAPSELSSRPASRKLSSRRPTSVGVEQHEVGHDPDGRDPRDGRRGGAGRRGPGGVGADRQARCGKSPQVLPSRPRNLT